MKSLVCKSYNVGKEIGRRKEREKILQILFCLDMETYYLVKRILDKEDELHGEEGQNKACSR